jgi:hypothetical protein
MEINARKTVLVEAKTLQIYMKVCDQFVAALLDQNGQALKKYEGYVPDFMPEDHYGDYLILDIDIDTGRITNWKAPSAQDLEAFIKGDED